ncbi:hypothetical protein COLO4_22928 [Corchorus olitorius]|uniref:Uncharacterized protein n=1 Tax=Corchorus olitorius TaxID=93759 RepID=A0A1R3IIX8_9ROSI|nr:hypothetical protein COLO4_22928 [Corchorus olitorius]
MASLIRSLHLETAATFNELKALSFQDFDDDPSLGCSDSGDSTVGMASSFGVLFHHLPSINRSVQFELANFFSKREIKEIEAKFPELVKIGSRRK